MKNSVFSLLLVGLIPIFIGCGGKLSIHRTSDLNSQLSAPLLANFMAAPGTVSSGDILLSLTFGDVSSYSQVIIRRTAGSKAPDCVTGGSNIKIIDPPFTNQSITDATGENGGVFSYRVCVYNTLKQLVALNVQENITAHHLNAPEGSFSFFAGTGTQLDGEINLNWAYPLYMAGYSQLRIVRTAGNIPPYPGCVDGSPVVTVPPPFLLTHLVDQTGAIYGETFSYRACLYNALGEVESEKTVAGVAAMFSGYSQCPSGSPELVVDATNPEGASYLFFGAAGRYRIEIYSPPSLSDSQYYNYTWGNWPTDDRARIHGGDVFMLKNKRPVYGLAADGLRVQNADTVLGAGTFIDPPYSSSRQNAADLARGSSTIINLEPGDVLNFVVNAIKNKGSQGDFSYNVGALDIRTCPIRVGY